MITILRLQKKKTVDKDIITIIPTAPVLRPVLIKQKYSFEDNGGNGSQFLDLNVAVKVKEEEKEDSNDDDDVDNDDDDDDDEKTGQSHMKSVPFPFRTTGSESQIFSVVPGMLCIT